jgi:hypothetical protein
MDKDWDPRNRSSLDPPQVVLLELGNGCATKQRDKEHSMMDILMLALGLAFFVAAIGYTYACERL